MKNNDIREVKHVSVPLPAMLTAQQSCSLSRSVNAHHTTAW